MELTNLPQLLEYAARNPKLNCILYRSGYTAVPEIAPYKQLLGLARENSKLLSSEHGFRPGRVVLLHFHDPFDSILWFWSVVLAGGLPAMSTPLPKVSGDRISHIRHLWSLLEQPQCLTREALKVDFEGQKEMTPISIEDLVAKVVPAVNGYSPPTTYSFQKGLGAEVTQTINCNGNGSAPQKTPAVLFLTSGSTGSCKAVGLNQQQILAALASKSTVCEGPRESTMLNWIGLDHVAGLIEIHLLALYQAVSQVHVPTAYMVAEPTIFLDLISRHRSSRTFAPNFFLAKLRSAIQDRLREQEPTEAWDLSCLRFVACGGEPIVTETCTAVAALFERFGAAKHVIVPAFGMTETCAGCIYNTTFPEYDITEGLEFASLGRCMSGVEMRITEPSSGGRKHAVLEAGQAGDLELQGPVVFGSYFNDEAKTAETFTSDGWFKTGDRGYITRCGRLVMTGRRKEDIIVNGVNRSPQEIESAIEAATIPGTTSSFTICFPTRPERSETEVVCVAYLPTFEQDDMEARVQTLNAIVKAVMLAVGSTPRVLPLDGRILQKSSIGKLSRTRVKRSFESGELKNYEEANDAYLKTYRAGSSSQPATPLESLLLSLFHSVLPNLGGFEFGVETSILESGVTSVDVIRLKRHLDANPTLAVEVPLEVLLTHPTARLLATAIDALSPKGPGTSLDPSTPSSEKEYDPVVPLRTSGSKTPLWLVHPGVGQVLVFVGLANLFTDRPVFALRARGFGAGEKRFGSIVEAVATYRAAIKRRQPHGPYALAGYSYGAMLAFETAKLLESSSSEDEDGDGKGEGDEVRFLGCFNLPPRIKTRMRQLDWKSCLLHLAYFLDLIGADAATRLGKELEEELGGEEAGSEVESEDQKQLQLQQQSSIQSEGPCSRSVVPPLSASATAHVLARVLEAADPARLAELALSPRSLVRWADIAFGLQGMATAYEPSGSVGGMDVFYCVPLEAVAASKEEWREKHISRWRDFSRSEPRFRNVEGEHYTIIGPRYVRGFFGTLRRALEERGL